MKEWPCNNQCGKDCCTEIFLELTEKQKEDFEKNGQIKTGSKYTDWRWLSFHKSITIEKSHVTRTIYIDKESIKYKILFAKPIKKHIVRINDPCIKLLPNGKCKIYRIRPKSCRIADCPVFSNTAMMKFIGKNSPLNKIRTKLNPKQKEKIDMYEK